MSEFLYSSDPHLNHEFIAQWRKFSSVKAMNECLMDNYSQVLSPKKTLVLLGDIAFGDKDEAYKLLKKLPGKKILIAGNHDNKKIMSWDIWSEVTLYKEMKDEGKSLSIFHFPIEDWSGKHRGVIHLHGHEHGALPDYANRIDVGVDNPKWEFKPVSIEQILEQTKHLPKHPECGHHKYECSKEV